MGIQLVYELSSVSLIFKIQQIYITETRALMVTIAGNVLSNTSSNPR